MRREKEKMLFILLFGTFSSERPIKNIFLPSRVRLGCERNVMSSEIFWQNLKFQPVKLFFVRWLRWSIIQSVIFPSPSGCLLFEILMSCFRLLSSFSANFHVFDCFSPTRTRQSWVQNLKEKSFKYKSWLWFLYFLWTASKTPTTKKGKEN